MVELIIVIAIMAILAAALAPALIKYINKSRLSTDISTGTSIASAIQTALSNESAYDDCADVDAQPFTASTFTGKMKDEVVATIDPAKCVVKSKKDMNGTAIGGTNFIVTVKPTTNEVTVWIGAKSTDRIVSPSVAKCLTEKTN
ncbi:MAG: hypothetical protein ACI4F4_06390 [Lachnospiraceae bacterium]